MGKNKKLYIIIAIIVGSVLVLFWWASVFLKQNLSRRNLIDNFLPPPPSSDLDQDINRDLEKSNVGDINEGFQQIDQDLNNL